jgi:hypothetical protein
MPCETLKRMLETGSRKVCRENIYLAGSFSARSSFGYSVLRTTCNSAELEMPIDYSARLAEVLPHQVSTHCF